MSSAALESLLERGLRTEMVNLIAWFSLLDRRRAECRFLLCYRLPVTCLSMPLLIISKTEIAACLGCTALLSWVRGLKIALWQFQILRQPWAVVKREVAS